MRSTTITSTITSLQFTRPYFSVLLLSGTVILGAACGSGGSGNGDSDAGTTVDAADNRPDAFVPANCDSLTKPTGQARYISHIPGHEDFGFDAEGYLIGVRGSGLVRSDYQGTTEEVIPGVGSGGARGTRQLPGGDYVIAVVNDNNGDNEVRRYNASGSPVWKTQINDPNGIVVASNGMIYVTAGSGTVHRLTPDTGEKLLLHQGSSFDGITLSPDESTLYFNSEIEGNLEGGVGPVYSLQIDDNGAVGTAKRLVDVPMSGNDFLLDGMTTDACGNLYLIKMGAGVWRYSTNGVLEEWVPRSALVPAPDLIPALNFGSGIGGWKNDSLYIITFGNGVYEIDLGVRGRPSANL